MAKWQPSEVTRVPRRSRELQKNNKIATCNIQHPEESQGQRGLPVLPALHKRQLTSAAPGWCNRTWLLAEPLCNKEENCRFGR